MNNPIPRVGRALSAETPGPDLPCTLGCVRVIAPRCRARCYSRAVSATEPKAPQPGAGVPVWVVVAGATILGTVVPVVLHHGRHETWNANQMAMAFFFWLNSIIAYWEICLFFRIDGIRDRYETYRQRYAGRELDRVFDFFKEKMPLSETLSMSRWADVWASYSLFDESYSNKKSFGFFIDIGNGFTTLIPSLVFVYGITFQFISARALGLLGLLISYQMFYGTAVYFTSYIMNRRYRGHSLLSTAMFVGLSNGLWTAFPLWAMVLSVRMIYADDFSVFLG